MCFSSILNWPKSTSSWDTAILAGGIHMAGFALIRNQDTDMSGRIRIFPALNGSSVGNALKTSLVKPVGIYMESIALRSTMTWFQTWYMTARIIFPKPVLIVFGA